VCRARRYHKKKIENLKKDKKRNWEQKSAKLEIKIPLLDDKITKLNEIVKVQKSGLAWERAEAQRLKDDKRKKDEKREKENKVDHIEGFPRRLAADDVELHHPQRTRSVPTLDRALQSDRARFKCRTNAHYERVRTD